MNFLFITAGEKIAGIIYQPESLQGMKENLERILQFMASKKIRMHQITSKEILEGNLKAVMRLILALAAHYKPQSVKHHDVSYDNIPEGKGAPSGSAVDKPDTRSINGEIRCLSGVHIEYKPPLAGCPPFFASSLSCKLNLYSPLSQLGNS